MLTTTRPENIAAEIPGDLVDADETLCQYGRWAVTGSRGGRPVTPDRQFRPEMDRHESSASWAERCSRPPRQALMTTKAALIVQRTLANLPDRERIVLACLYIPRRVSPVVQLQILKIPPSHSRALHMLGLRRFDSMHKIALKGAQ